MYVAAVVVGEGGGGPFGVASPRSGGGAAKLCTYGVISPRQDDFPKKLSKEDGFP